MLAAGLGHSMGIAITASAAPATAATAHHNEMVRLRGSVAAARTSLAEPFV
jgi:hypothetical protein